MDKRSALHQMQKFCAYRERCHQEVRTKLLQLKVYGDDLEEIISELISEGFLNEERFAKAYVSGKYRIKLWGRAKILQGLKQKKISAYCIKKGMAEIDENTYISNLEKILVKKFKTMRVNNNYEAMKKLMTHAQLKGYEYESIKPIAHTLINEVHEE